MIRIGADGQSPGQVADVDSDRASAWETAEFFACRPQENPRTLPQRMTGTRTQSQYHGGHGIEPFPGTKENADRRGNDGRGHCRGSGGGVVGNPFQLDEIVTPVQPYAARKRYACPGCNGSIEPGAFHLVVIPEHAPDLRRHWHHGCWFKEQRRRRRPLR